MLPRSLLFNTLDYVPRVASWVLQRHTPPCVERGEALGTGSQGLRAPVDGLQATEPMAINSNFAKALFTWAEARSSAVTRGTGKKNTGA